MKRTNIVYWILPPLALLLAYVFWGRSVQPVAFYGFAEAEETRLSHREPLRIVEVPVRAGEAVTEGQVLVRAAVKRDPEGAVAEPFEIAELRAKARVWRAEQDDELRVLERRQQLDRAEARTAVERAREQLAYQRSLVADLQSVADTGALARPRAALRAAEQYLIELQQTQLAERTRLERRRDRARSPYDETIKRLEAEQAFAADRLTESIAVRAPYTGLVGNVFARAGEYLDAYVPLLSLYAPAPGSVRGYVHEDLRLRVALGDEFEVASLLHPDRPIRGTVTGLGARIVEIPARLRKLPELRTYGREVIVRIPVDNRLLQREKVSLRHLGPPALGPEARQ